MSVIWIDGPEKAGKTTLIKRLTDTFDPHGDTIRVRRWGPVESWHEYIRPLMEDLALAAQFPGVTTIWDRSVASEVCYNDLLLRGRAIRDEEVRVCLEDTVRFWGGEMLMLFEHESVLEQRRLEWIEQGGKPDLPVRPADEIRRFFAYAMEHDWLVMGGETDPDNTTTAMLRLSRAITRGRTPRMKGL